MDKAISINISIVGATAAERSFQVGACLAFMSESFMALAHDGELTKQAMLGAGLIIDGLASALRDVEEEAGGAA